MADRTQQPEGYSLGLKASHDVTLQLLEQVQHQQFHFWWNQTLKGRKAGSSLVRLWQDNPFGALTVASDWALWSTRQVTEYGRAQARDCGVDGLMIASAPGTSAALCWSTVPVGPPVVVVLHSEAGQVVPGDPGQGHPIMSVDRFLEFAGFNDENQVVPCAVLACSAGEGSVLPTHGLNRVGTGHCDDMRDSTGRHPSQFRSRHQLPKSSNPHFTDAGHVPDGAVGIRALPGANSLARPKTHSKRVPANFTGRELT